MKAIILAAGIGERMRPLTKDTPKPMLLINNTPVIEYIISLLRKYEITEIAITTFYLKDKIIKYLGDGSKLGVNITYLEEKTLIPSAKAIKQLSNFVEDEVLIINGDNLTDMNLNEFTGAHRKNRADITISGYLRKPEDKPSSQLDFNDNFKLIRFREKMSEEEMNQINPEKRIANMGIYIFNKKVIDSISDTEELDLGKMFHKFVKNGFRIYVYPIGREVYFKEIGKMERFMAAKEEIELGKVKLNIK